MALARQIKVNVPQPGETKSQFITRSIRVLMSAGKSKQNAISIATRVWDTVAKSSQVTPNDVDANVSFGGTVKPQRKQVRDSQVYFNPMHPQFADLSNKLNRNQIQSDSPSSITNESMMRTLQNTLQQSLSPLSRLSMAQSKNPNGEHKSSYKPNIVNNVLNQNIKQQLQIQQETLSVLNSLAGINNKMYEELSTMRSTGMSIRKTKMSSSPPSSKDFWTNTTTSPQLRFGKFDLEHVISQVAGDSPSIKKFSDILRTVIHPVQSFRRTVGGTVRKGITKLRELGQDINTSYQDDPNLLKEHAGIRSLDDDQLKHKTITKSIPDKIAELVSVDREQIDILRNIYSVNKDSLKYMSQGSVDHQYTKTISNKRQLYDSDTGEFLDEDAYNAKRKSNAKLQSKYLQKLRNDRKKDPILSMMDKLIAGTDKISKTMFGSTGRLSNDELDKYILDRETNDPHLVDHLRKRQMTRDAANIELNELSGARQFGSKHISATSYSHATGIATPRLNEVMSEEDLKQLGDNAYLQRPDGSFILDKSGNKKYKYAKHDQLTNELTTERGAKFHYNDLERAHAKENTLNPIDIGRDIANEIKVVLHPLTQVIHDNIDSNSNFLFKALKMITPNISQPDIANNNRQSPDYLKISRSLVDEIKSQNDDWADKINKTQQPTTTPPVIPPTPSPIGGSPNLKEILDILKSIDNKQDQLLTNTATTQYRLVTNEKAHPIFAHILSMPDPNTKSHTDITSVGEELDKERDRREQEKRDNTQQEIADQLKALVEQNSKPPAEVKPDEEDKKGGGFFKWLLSGLAALGGLLFGGGGVLAGGVAALSKAGGLIAKFAKFGLALEGISLVLNKFAPALYKIFGGTSRKEGQSVDDWKHENAWANAGMSAVNHGVSAAGHLLGAKVAEEAAAKGTTHAASTAARGVTEAAEASGKAASSAGKIAGEVGEVAAKGAAKTGMKGLLKGLGHSALKKIPVVGALFGIYSGIERWNAGDYVGSFLEVASGVASIFPGVGTAISLGIDGVLLLRDLFSEQDTPKEGETKKEDTNKYKNSSKMFSRVKDIFKSVWDIVTFNDFFGGITRLGKNAMLLPMNGISTVLEFLGFNWLSDKVQSATDRVDSTATQAVDKVKTTAKDAMNKSKKLFQGAYLMLTGEYRSGLSVLMEAAKELDIPGITPILEFLNFDWVSKITTKAKDLVSDGWDKTKDAVKEGMDAAQEAAKSGLNAAQEAAKSGLNTAQKTASTAVDELKQRTTAESNPVNDGMMYHAGGQIKMMHDGGITGNLYAQHSTGLLSSKTSTDKVPIIAQKDEYILTKHETRSILSVLKSIAKKLDFTLLLDEAKKVSPILEDMYDEQLAVQRKIFTPMEDLVFKDIKQYDGIYSMLYRLIHDPLTPTGYIPSSKLQTPGLAASMGIGGGAAPSGYNPLGSSTPNTGGGYNPLGSSIPNTSGGFNPFGTAPTNTSGGFNPFGRSSSGSPAGLFNPMGDNVGLVAPSGPGLDTVNKSKVIPRQPTYEGFNNAKDVGINATDNTSITSNGQATGLRGLISSAIEKRTNDRYGLKYRWGGTSDRTGYDCSGWTRTTMVDTMQKINQAAGTQVYSDKLINTMRNAGTSEGIIDTFSAKGFPIKQGRPQDFDHSQIKEGSIISLSTGASFAKDRAKQIDHVIMTYRGADGQMYVSESQGSSGIKSMLYTDYMRYLRQKRNPYMYVVDPLSGAQTDEQQNKTGLDEMKGKPGLPPIAKDDSGGNASASPSAGPIPATPGLDSQKVANSSTGVMSTPSVVIDSTQPLDSLKQNVQEITTSQKQLDERPLPESNQQQSAPNQQLQLPKPSIVPPTHGNVPRNLSQYENGQPISGASNASVASNQEWGSRAIDPVTNHMIDAIFSNTIINFQQASNNYAVGNNPMSPVHV